MRGFNRALFGVSLIALSCHGTANAQTGQPTQTDPQTGSGSPATSTEAAGTVQAPSVADATAGNDIVVTGFRNSLQAALDTKRNATQFVDAIVAADIGKLPDQSIADSLQRVSGVQIRRVLGTGTSVSIRGLRQNRIEVNGRTLISPFGRGVGDGTLADLNPLTLYPAEVISRLEVTKLLSADQAEGSLGGTINIITRRPLDSDKRLIAASAEASHATLSSREGFKASALFSDSFADGRFGFLLNLAYDNQPVQEDSFNSFAGFLPLAIQRDAGGNRTTFADDPNRDGLQGTYIADLRFQRLTDRRKRFSVNNVLQWRASDELLLTLDSLYTSGTSRRDRNWFAAALSSNVNSYTNPIFSPNEVLLAGTINTPFQGNDELNRQKDYGITTAAQARYESGPVLLTGEFDYSKSKFEYSQTYVRTQSIANYPIAFDLRGEVPSLTLTTGINTLDPALYRYSNFFDNRYPSEAKELAGRVDLRYNLGGFISAIQVGAKLTDLTTIRRVFSTQLTSNVTLPSRSSSLYQTASFPGILGGAAPFAQSYLIGNPFGTGEQFACTAINPPCTPEAFDRVGSFDIQERTKAAYAKAEYKFDLGAVAVSGNVGLRYSNDTRVVVGAFPNATGGFTPLRIEPHFDSWLPSAVAKVELTDDFLVRIGAAKVVAMPDTGSLSPGLFVNRIVNPPTASSGNPNLNPFRATQYDVSAEWYFHPGAALTIGLFKKDIASFLVTQSSFETLPGETSQVLITRQVNGNGGKLKGVELLAQLPFYFLPTPFNGFGFQANYSYIDSSTPFVNARTQEELPLTGLSKHNVNLIAFYEKGGFGIRGAYNYRSKFLDAITAGGEGTFFRAYETFDASVRYDFGHFAVNAEVSNITNAKQVRYTGATEAIALYAEQGRRFAVGVSTRF